MVLATACVYVCVCVMICVCMYVCVCVMRCSSITWWKMVRKSNATLVHTYTSLQKGFGMDRDGNDAKDDLFLSKWLVVV